MEQTRIQPETVVANRAWRAEARELDVRALLGILRRQARSIAAVAALILCLVLLITTQLDRRFTATTLLVVDTRESQLLGSQSVSSDQSALEAVDTEAEIIRSASVLTRAVATLDLARYPSLAPKASLLRNLAVKAGMLEPESPFPAEWSKLSAAEQAKLLSRLSDTLRVFRRGRTRVIEVSATALSPNEAAEIANLVSEAYLDDQIEGKLFQSRRAADLLRRQLDNAAARMQEIESEIDRFVLEKADELDSQGEGALSKLRQELAASTERDKPTEIILTQKSHANSYPKRS